MLGVIFPQFEGRKSVALAGELTFAWLYVMLLLLAVGNYYGDVSSTINKAVLITWLLAFSTRLSILVVMFLKRLGSRESGKGDEGRSGTRPVAKETRSPIAMSSDLAPSSTPKSGGGLGGVRLATGRGPRRIR